MYNLENSKKILRLIGMPDRQTVDIPALTLLAMAGLEEGDDWKKAGSEWIRIHDIIQFVNSKYGTTYSENTRETFRKQAIHHFRIAGIIKDNGKATNSPHYRYKLTTEFLKLIQTFGTSEWETKLDDFLKDYETLISKYESKRKISKIPVKINNNLLEFSTGIHNELQKAIIEEFAPRFAQNSEVLYVGDTTNKSLILNERKLKGLGFEVVVNDKMPDVVMYNDEKNWLYFVEAVTSVGEISPKRIFEIEEMTKDCTAGNVYITAFPDFKTYKKFAQKLAWDTEVWLSELPDHMIHLNGDRFMGPRE